MPDDEIVLPAGPGQRFWLNWLDHRARRFRIHRERVNSLYAFGYGQFRRYFIALGEALAGRGLLARPEDIFYLYLDEVRQLVKQGRTASPVITLVAERRQEMQAAASGLLPDIIYGEQTPPLEDPVQKPLKLAGIPASPGYYTGKAQIIRSMDEFDRMIPGTVLVVPHSDVSWTPLFSQAGAVVSESGGMLSHSAIVAREHRLPAVVCLSGACTHINSGARITVDGYKGEVTLHKGHEE